MRGTNRLSHTQKNRLSMSDKSDSKLRIKRKKDTVKNDSLTERSQKLRCEMTKEESALWYGFLKKLDVTFHRQKVFGHYILDFYCARNKLAIEIDGGQHRTREHYEYENRRTDYLNSHGVRVIRFSNVEVRDNFEGVCRQILKEINHPVDGLFRS